MHRGQLARVQSFRVFLEQFSRDHSTFPFRRDTTLVAATNTDFSRATRRLKFFDLMRRLGEFGEILLDFLFEFGD